MHTCIYFCLFLCLTSPQFYSIIVFQSLLYLTDKKQLKTSVLSHIILLHAIITTKHPFPAGYIWISVVRHYCGIVVVNKAKSLFCCPSSTTTTTTSWMATGWWAPWLLVVAKGKITHWWGNGLNRLVLNGESWCQTTRAVNGSVFLVRCRAIGGGAPCHCAASHHSLSSRQCFVHFQTRQSVAGGSNYTSVYTSVLAFLIRSCSPPPLPLFSWSLVPPPRPVATQHSVQGLS